MRKSLILAAALLTLAGTALTPSDAEARWRGGGYYGGFRSVGFARPAFGGFGYRGYYGYPRYGYYRRGFGYGGALAAGLVGGAGLSAATACDPYTGCGYGYGYGYPAYYGYGYGYPGATVVIRRTYYAY